MKILILSHMFPNNTNRVSGIFVYEQAKALVKLGCDVRIISPVQLVPFPLNLISEKWKRYYNIQKYEDMNGIKVYYPRMVMMPRDIMFHNSGKIYFHAINSIINEISKDFKFDLVHCHTALPDGYAGTLIKDKYNKPLVTTIHGNDFQNTININAKRKKAIVYTVERSDKVVTVSKKLENIGHSLYYNANKFTTVHNGVELDNIHNYDEKLDSKYKGKKVILSVGNLINSKGHDLTIKAFKEILKVHPEAHLIIIGGGEEKSNLNNLVQELALAGKVELTGQLPHEHVMSYMEICTLFVLPSWKEGFGVVYVEAMAHGKAIIGCKEEGIQDIIDNWKNGVLVNKKDVEDLVKSISRLMDNPDLMENIGRKAKETVFNNLSWENNAQEYLDIYNELISNS